MKNSRSKKLLLVFITLSVLLPALASCSEKPVDETTADTTAPAAETETETEAEDTELLPDIPKLDFEGRTFTILTSGLNDTNGKDWITYDVYAESINGEPINDAVFERNEYLNSTYNIKLAEYQTQKDTLSELKTEVTANTGAFQAAMTHFENGATLSRQGALMDM